jgi:hypothetical protein
MILPIGWAVSLLAADPLEIADVCQHSILLFRQDAVRMPGHPQESTFIRDQDHPGGAPILNAARSLIE